MTNSSTIDLTFFDVMAIWYFIMGVINLLDLNPFQSKRSKMLSDEKRKRFRRMESIVCFLLAVYALSMDVVDRWFRVDLQLPMVLTIYVIIGVLIVAYGIYIEQVYFKKFLD